MNKNDAEEY